MSRNRSNRYISEQLLRMLSTLTAQFRLGAHRLFPHSPHGSVVTWKKWSFSQSAISADASWESFIFGAVRGILKLVQHKVIMKIVTAAEEYAKNADALRTEDVTAILEWVKGQPHLPAVSEFEAILFLHSNYYDLAETQKTIENYYTLRTNYTEFFGARDITSAELQETLRVMWVFYTTNKHYHLWTRYGVV